MRVEDLEEVDAIDSSQKSLGIGGREESSKTPHVRGARTSEISLG